MDRLSAKLMREALKELDGLLPKPVTLIVGGGSAMLLAHAFPLTTTDIDAVPKGLSSEELKPHIENVARRLEIPADWLNPWYGSFTNVLPDDYSSRLIEVFKGEKITALALGKEDLLLMKCFAHRKKDVPHARALVRGGANTDQVYEQIEALAKIRIPNTERAKEFLEDIIEMEEG